MSGHQEKCRTAQNAYYFALQNHVLVILHVFDSKYVICYRECQHDGGDLVFINSKREMKFLIDSINDLSNDSFTDEFEMWSILGKVDDPGVVKVNGKPLSVYTWDKEGKRGNLGNEMKGQVS